MPYISHDAPESLHRYIRGGGFFDTIWKYSHSLWKYIQPVAKSIYENPETYATLARATTGYFRSNKINPSSQKWLDENQNSEIVSLKAVRSPVSQYLEDILTLVTNGKYAEAKKGLSYDKMFHLALVMELRDENGNLSLNKLEKTSQPNFLTITDEIFSNPKLESIDIPLNGKQITAGEFVKKAQEAMGTSFYDYNAFSTNCQHFVMGLLNANGLGSSEIKEFVYQKVDELLQQQPEYTSDFAKFITNLTHIKDRIFQGYGSLKKANHSEKSAMMIGGKKYIRMSVPTEYSGGANTNPSEGKKYSGLEEQLSDWGMDKKRYFQSLSKNARKHGYNPKMIGLATDGIHKIQIQTPEGRVVKFGRLGYGDYILWKALEAQGKTQKGFADQKQSVFHSSHTKIRGNWKRNDYSPNNLALRLLW